MEDAMDIVCQWLEDTFSSVDTCKKCPNEYWKKEGCCRKCAEEKGYFRFSERHWFEKNEHLFNKDTGFFDKERKTCILPRKERSHGCQMYRCGHFAQALEAKGHKEKSINRVVNWICRQREKQLAFNPS